MLGQAGLAGLLVTAWTLANAFVTIMLVPARSHAPVSRRDRPAKPPLTCEGIITVASAFCGPRGWSRADYPDLPNRHLDATPAANPLRTAAPRVSQEQR